MKSPLLIMSCFVVSVLIMGCESEQTENTLSRLNIKGDVKSYINKTYDVTIKFGEIEKESIRFYWVRNFNEEGNEVESIFYNSDGSLSTKDIFKYDEEGNLLELITYKSDGSFDIKSTMKYDEEGNEVEYIRSDDSGILFKHSYKYDEKGNQVERFSDFSFIDGEGVYTSTMKYDEEGNLLEDTFFQLDGSSEGTTTYEYDEEGNLLEKITCNSDGSIERKITYDYDEEGNEIEMITRPAWDGSFQYKTTSEYEYDKEKNWTRKISFTNDVAKAIIERDFEYYNH